MKRSPLRRQGRISRRWLRVRKQWFDDNPRDWYECYICHRSLLPAEVELDHVKSRSRYPELRFEPSNLAPICRTDNFRKGSLSLEQYKAKLD